MIKRCIGTFSSSVNLDMIDLLHGIEYCPGSILRFCEALGDYCLEQELTLDSK